MASKYTKVAAGQNFRFSAGLYNDLVDLVTPGASTTGGYIDALTRSGSVIIPVKNISGSDRERFDCMALGDMRFELGADAKESIIFDVDTADPDEPAAILIGPIADGKYGRACIFGLAIARIASGSATALVGTPNASGHNLTTSDGFGTIRLLAPGSATLEKIRPVLLGVGSGGSHELLFTLTGTVASGTGTATIRNLADTTDVATGATLNDPLGHFDGLTSGYRGFCFLDSGSYYAIGPYVTKVRWDDPDLEYSRDNATTWINIDTAEDCS